MDRFPEPRRSLLAQAVAAAVLLAAVVAPGADLAIHGADTESVKRERRNPAPFPKLGLSRTALVSFPRGFDRWFQDAFGLRDVLIRMHNRAAIFGLGISPIETLLVGDEGWIFHLEQKAMETFRGLEPFEEWELQQWKRCLELRRDVVRSQGGEFVVAHVPSKLEVYDDHVPARFKRVGSTRRVQLLEYLSEHSDLNVVDLLPALQAETRLDRPDRHAYFPHGVHWTDSGAAAASRQLIGSLGDGPFHLKPLSPEVFEPKYGVEHLDSWARRLHLEGEIVANETALQRVGGWRSHRNAPRDPAYRRDRNFTQDDASLPTAVLFHDSMGAWLIRFLAEHFSRIDGLRRIHFTPLILDELRADIVFEVFSERQLAMRWPTIPALAFQDGLSRAFESSDDVRLRLDPAHDLKLEPGLDQATLHRVEGALEIEVEASANALAIPSFDASMPTTVGEFLVLKLDLESPGEGQIDVSYKLAPDDPLDVLRSYALEGQEGRHVLYIPLSNPRMIGTDVLLRVGHRPGRYVLRHAEIRAVREG
jgi:hypothetical protein